MKRRLATVAIVLIGAAPALAGPSAAAAADAGPVPATAHSSVIGGHSASIDEFPWLADIEGEDAEGHVFGCTGTVVAPRVVLTAGHCVEDLESSTVYSASGYAVATGVADISQVQQKDVSLVSQAVVYPGFSPATLRGDAGILILSSPVTAPALRLASASDRALLKPRTRVSISGWGLVSPKAKEAPAALQSARTVIQRPRYCRQLTANYYPFYSSTSQLCAIDSPGYAVSACHGDSGGPAIARGADGLPVEVGITSIGGPRCSPSFPNIFTRVERVSAWVASWVAAVESGGPEPAISTPKAHLPKMSFARARYFSGLGLEQDFRSRFLRGLGKRIRCVRAERVKVKCGVSWHQGGNDYFGTITVYFAISRNTVVWRDRYTIHWVNDHCWFDSGHRQACRIHTRIR